MRKSLLIRFYTLVALLLTGLAISAQTVHELYKSKTMGFDELVGYELYQSALQWTNANKESNSLLDEINRNKLELISKLRTNYPELHSELYQYDNQLKNDSEVSDIIAALVKKESANGLIPKNTNIIQYAQSLGIDKKQSSALSFYYAYELFKKKKYREAINQFKPNIKNRTDEYNYSLYYSGLASLLIGDYESSRNYLLKIGREPQLETFLPYYLAADHYALEDYGKVIKFYADRTTEPNLYNTQGLNKIVSYAHYNQEQYQAATRYLSQIKVKNETDNLLLSICYNKSHDYNRTIELLATSKQSLNPELRDRLNFEKAIALGAITSYDESIILFNSLINSNIDKNLIQWNITILLAKKGDYANAISQAQSLLGSEYHQQAQQLIQDNLDKIEDPNAIASISRTLAQSSESKTAVTDNLYYRALKAIQANSWQEADSYIQMLYSTDAYSSQYFELLGYKGLQQYQDGNIIEAKKNLSTFSKGANSVDNSELSADVHYHLGYLYFKEKNPKSALGYFSKSLELMKLASTSQERKEDIYNRIGDVYLLENDLTQAEQHYQYAYNSKGAKGDYSLYQLALIDELHGKYFDQIIHLEDLVEEYPHSHLLYKAELSTAHSLFELGKYEQAENHYRQVSQKAKDNIMIEEAIIQLGLINVNAGNYAQAEQYYQRIIQSSQNEEMRSRAVSSLKEIYSEYNVDTDAYIAISASESEGSDPDQIIFNLAKENYYNDNFELVIEQLKKLKTEYPGSKYIAEGNAIIVDTYIKQSNWPKAADQLILVLETNDIADKETRVNQLAEILYTNMGEYEVYLKYSEKGWFSGSDSSSTIDIGRRALSYLQINEITKCRALLSQVTEYPISKKIKEEIGNKLLQSYLASKDWEEVLLLKNELHGISSPKWTYAQALALMNQEKYEDGINLIMSENELLSQDNAWLVKSVILMSDMYYLIGDKTSAIAVLEGMLASDLQVPTNLKKQAEQRLNNFNL